jgi:hypothetical protein
MPRDWASVEQPTTNLTNGDVLSHSLNSWSLALVALVEMKRAVLYVVQAVPSIAVAYQRIEKLWPASVRVVG